jgi:hypothetical protein
MTNQFRPKERTWFKHDLGRGAGRPRVLVAFHVASTKTIKNIGKFSGGAGNRSPATSVPNVTNRRQNDADRATQHDSRQREVSASTPRATDEAIRVAVKLAIDAGDLTRARALLDLLDVEPRTAPDAFRREGNRPDSGALR